MLMRHRRLVGAGMALAIVALVIALLLQGGGKHRPPPVVLPGPAFKSPTDDPFAYAPGRDGALAQAAAIGESPILFERSPGGVRATAQRVAKFRPLIDAAARAGGVNPNALEGIVFLESAGQPDVVAGSDLANAAGLTQILAQTATGLLGMHVDLARSRKISAEIGRSQSPAHVKRLLATRRRVDERFAPAKALAATVRYLKIAKGKLGRDDLAVVSYHMGIGNLQRVIAAYGGGTPSYARLYFDSAPDTHPAAWRLLSSFGDESSLYYWKILGAERLMRLYRTDRSALRPPTLPAPKELLVGLPSSPGRLFLRYGRRAGPVTAGTRAMLVYVAARVRAISRAVTPLTVARSTGWTFSIARRYGSRAQAQAFQFVLDRLTAENLIQWYRDFGTIHVTVSGAATALVPRLRTLR
jgi:Transglycosylase SLT domain